MATARRVVISYDANLSENGGCMEITKSWAQRLLERMNLVKRKDTTGVKVHFEKLKKQFLSDVCSIVMEEIPEQLIINWDQTDLKYVQIIHLLTKGQSVLR